VSSAILELDGLLKFIAASVLDDLIDLHRGHDALGEIVQVEDLLVGFNGSHCVEF
jgi:hypothetical protein